HVVDEECVNLCRGAEASPRIPRAHERSFHDLRCEGSPTVAEVSACFRVWRVILQVEHLPQRFLVCERDAGRYGSVRTAVAGIERGRHEASQAVVDRPDHMARIWKRAPAMSRR